MTDRLRRLAVVSIGAGRSQLPLIVSARSMGFQVVAVDREPGAPGFGHADVALTMSTHDTDGVVRAVRGLRREYDFRGVLARTTAPEALSTAAAVSRDLGVAGLTPELVRISTEKSKLREFGHVNGLRVPRGTRVGPEWVAAAQIHLPALVKPDVTRVGKAGVRLCAEPANTAGYVNEAMKASANGCAEVECYLEGIDCSCLCVAGEGRALVVAWWDELVGIDSEDRVVALGVSVPSIIEGTGSQREAERAAAGLAGCFPTVHALLILSFRVTMVGVPHIIEVHSDLGGDLIADVLLPAANPGFDFFELAVQVATGAARGAGRVGFQPTALYYQCQRRAGSGGPPGEGVGYRVLRQASIGESLALLPDMVRSRGLELRVPPLHAEWHGRNHTGVPG